MKEARFSQVRQRTAAGIGLIAVLLATSWTAAKAEGTSAASSVDQTNQAFYDTGHEYVTERLQRAAAWFDGFFGDPRSESDGDASAYMHVVFDAFYSGVEDQSENGIRFRGGADLPRLDKRLRLLITSDADSAVTGRDLAGTAEEDIKDTDGAVGLRYLFRDRPNDKFALGGGLSGGISPEVLMAARHIHSTPWTQNTVSHITSTLYWKSDDGAGVSSLLDYEWSPDPKTLWRYSLFGNWRDKIQGLEWSTQAKWAHRIDDKTAVNVRAGVQGRTEPNNSLTEGWLKFLYRRNFLRSWLFYEVEPGLSCHEIVDYRVEPTIALRLEVQFRRD